MYFEKIAEIIAQQLGTNVEDIKPETTLESLGGDSLDMVEIIMSLEDEYAVEFEENTVFETVGQIVKYVEQQRADA